MDPNSPFCRFLQSYTYALPSPPPRTRTKPMAVICVGFPRSGTESLQQALLTLGYDYTYHGWDIMFEEHSDMPAWAELGRRKFYPRNGEEDRLITRSEFDELLGHAVAVTDAPGSCFARDLILAYPEAKVVLNERKDREAWKASAVKNLVGINENWLFWALSWFDAEMWWMWHVYERMLWYGLFRCWGGGLRSGVEGKGRMLVEEHGNMVRGLMRRLGRGEELLEWKVGDGWEPLCKFLGREVPRDEGGGVMGFPRANDRKEWEGRERKVLAEQGRRAVRNLGLMVAGVAAVVGGLWWKWRRLT